MPSWLRRNPSGDDLGGVWRRLRDDALTVAARVPAVAGEVDRIVAVARAGQSREASSTLEVPADAVARALLAGGQQAVAALREVEYRLRLQRVEPGAAAQQQQRAEQALARARVSLDRLSPYV